VSGVAAALALEGIALKQGDFALEDIELVVARSEYAVLMGRTGSGKTSLLELTCGLRAAAAGRVLLDGRDATELAPAARGIGYVPQEGALFPYMRIGDQMALPLRLRGVRRAQQRERVLELAGWLGIEALLERSPRGLSGGERQRVALGRALSFRPALLALDEPLGALDEETRDELCGLLARAREESGAAVLHVTHNRAEAERLGDRVLQLADGRIRAHAPA